MSRKNHKATVATLSEPHAETEGQLRCSADFVLRESRSAKTGLRIVRVEWAPDGRPSGFVVTLRERLGAAIQIDYGKTRGRDARRSTKQFEWDLAVKYAETRLRRLVNGRASDMTAEETVDRIEDAEGAPLLLDVFNYALEKKNGRVSAAWFQTLTRVRDIVVALFGVLIGALDPDQDFIDTYLKRRTTASVKLANGRTLKPCKRVTAAKELWIICTVLNFAFTTRIKGTKRVMIPFNPLALEGIAMPDSKSRKPKQPLLYEDHYPRLMLPVLINGTWRDAPIDRVDATGTARMITCMIFHHNRRRDNLLLAKRWHLAITKSEVRAVFRKLRELGVANVHEDMADDFPNGVFVYCPENEKQARRANENPLDWWRFYPLSEEVRGEFDLYDERTGCYSWSPDAWLFRDPEDSSKPLKEGRFFQSATERRATEDGVKNFDEEGNAVIACKGDILRTKKGTPRKKNSGGWFRLAQFEVRKDAEFLGLDPDRVMPLYSGELAHGCKAGWARRMANLGWLSKVKDGGGEEHDLKRMTDYIGGRKVETSVLGVHYLGIFTTIAQAIADGRDAYTVLAALGKKTEYQARSIAEETKRAREFIRRKSRVKHGAL